MAYRYAATPSWVKVTDAAQMYLAPSTPKATGNEFKPMARSPSIDLKSLTIAIPNPAMEYKIGLCGIEKISS